MDLPVVVIIAAAVLGATLLVVGLALLVARASKIHPDTLELRSRFGPEYDRTVRALGSRKKAERNLLHRLRAVDALHIRPLDPVQHAQFASAWHEVQQRFVDDPRTAVSQGHDLIKQVMHARGYPVHDFDERVELLSVDHSDVVQHYRAARALAQSSAKDAASTTEDLRQAMVHYRALFTDLLVSREHEPSMFTTQPMEVRHGHA
jgi:hypothetical protein